MAHFEGSIQEFHHYLGPRIKNAVNLLAKKIRDNLNGKCEHCQEIRELQSAHVNGRGRRSIIENVLNSHLNGDVIRCDISKVENEILKAHLPIEEAFKFLCQSCHFKYDSKSSRPEESLSAPQVRPLQVGSPSEFKKIRRIKLWADRTNQINHKIVSAYLELEQAGPVSLSALRNLCTNSSPRNKYLVDNFDGHLAAMKTDNGNSHGNVFYVENGIVKIWPYVRKEIEKYWVKAKVT